MVVSLRMFLKDLAELSATKGLLILVFFAPVVLILLVGQIRVRDPLLRVAVEAESDRAYQNMKNELEELSIVQVIGWDWGTSDPPRRSQRERIDLLATQEGAGWHYSTIHTDPYKLRYVSSVVQYLVLARERQARTKEALNDLRVISSLVMKRAKSSSEESSGTASEQSPGDEHTDRPAASNTELQKSDEKVMELVDKMRREIEASTAMPVSMISAYLSNHFHRYFPPVSEIDRSLVPKLIPLIAVFISFLLGSAALVRERESGMLEAVIVAAKRNWMALSIGKLLCPIVVALSSLLLQLLFVASFFSLAPKPHLFGMLALQFLAVVASGLLGLSVSAYVRSQQQAYVVSAMYLLCLMLLTGFVFPLEQAGLAVKVASYALPLTFSSAPFEAWLTQGAGSALYGAEGVGLLVQSAVTAVIYALTLRQFTLTL